MKFKNLAKNFIAGLMVLSAGAFVFMCACGESSAEVPNEKDPFEDAEQNPSKTEEPLLPEKPAYIPYAEYEPFGRDKFGIENGAEERAVTISNMPKLTSDFEVEIAEGENVYLTLNEFCAAYNSVYSYEVPVYANNFLLVLAEEAFPEFEFEYIVSYSIMRNFDDGSVRSVSVQFGIEATGYIENSEGNLVECELFLRPYHVIDAEFLYACGQNDFAGAAMWQENSMGAKNAFCVGKYNNDIKSLGSWLIITVDFTPEQSQDEMARLNAIIYERVKNNICIYDYEYYSNLFLSADNADKQ